ncbi:hypothetical protein EC973_002786 [Apophysomyces ossiformis]|uniref:Uncharacterized protein n=1 Tax=Apophysomyces ossiformis TaxID=679940 RepID=A0A8H7BTQ4_9FUNG|nr:hypothetical protein EC973_002786 [Apophysomyces ossiformis]
MKIHTIVLGEYHHPPIPFCLYQFPTPVTPPLTTQESTIHFFSIQDLTHLFNMADDLIPVYREHPSYFCKDQLGRCYLMTKGVADIACKRRLTALAELCRLTDRDALTGAADPWLQQIPNLRPCPKHVLEQDLAPTRLDGREWFLKPSIRLSPPAEERSSTLPKPSSLLLKRLAPKQGNKATPHLTISTPSYDQRNVSIQSAPLHARRTATINGNRPHKVMKRSTLVPATSTGINFPSPPIVLSQHQQQQQQQQQQRHLTQKQQFLLPFEHLYDNLEQTRRLKSTLDDQIRRSSTLMKTLQTSSVMVEALVRTYMKDAIEQQFQGRLRECLNRVAALERLQQPSENNNNNDKPFKTTGASERWQQDQSLPSTPPTPSQQQKPTSVLAELMSRLDQLERKLDKRP